MANIDDQKLMELVRDYPHLYRADHQDHSRKNICENSWSEIGAALNTDGKAVKECWRVIHDRYVRAINKQQQQNRSGAGTSHVPKIIRDLGRLRSSIRHRGTETNFPVENVSKLSVNVITLKCCNVIVILLYVHLCM